MDTALLFDYDHTIPLAVQAAGDSRSYHDITVRDITFDNARGGRVEATLTTPPGEGPFAGILWVHWYEPSSPSSNRSQFYHEAIELAGGGVVSLLVDAFWSTTPKKWAEKPEHPWRSEVGHDTDLCARQVVELRRALDVLTAQPHVHARRIGYVGHDFGAMCGALLAAVEPRVKGYVLMAGTTTFSEWFLFGSKMPREDEQRYMEAMSPLDPVRHIGQAAPAALYFQFAHSDYYVPERTAQMFYDAASDPKAIVWYEAQHDLTHDEARPDRLRWLRAQLGLAP